MLANLVKRLSRKDSLLRTRSEKPVTYKVMARAHGGKWREDARSRWFADCVEYAKACLKPGQRLHGLEVKITDPFGTEYAVKP